MPQLLEAPGEFPRRTQTQGQEYTIGLTRGASKRRPQEAWMSGKPKRDKPWETWTIGMHTTMAATN